MSSHNSHYFLQHLAQALDPLLKGMELACAFSQSKDELVLGFCHAQAEFWIKALLLPDLQVLGFPESYQRAHRNSVDLFHAAVGQTVAHCHAFQNERAFALVFESGNALTFKMFGSRANVVYFEGGRAAAVFHHKFPADLDLAWAGLEQFPDQSQAAFLQLGLKTTFPAFGPEIIAFLKRKGYEGLPPAAQWALVQESLALLSSPVFTVTSAKAGKPALLLLPTGQEGFRSANALEAAREFFLEASRYHFFEREKQAVLKMLEKKSAQALGYLEKTGGKLKELEEHSRYEETANLIMANLHAVPAQADKLEVDDFYRGGKTVIKLNPKLSPQKNAENYYRKGKNQRMETGQLRTNLLAKERLMEELEKHTLAVAAAGSLKELRQYMKAQGLDQAQQEEKAFPFRRFEVGGYEVWVGRNAANNDLLTQRHAFKEDLWLHARDVTGSHVLLKHQAGKVFPPAVVEQAAAIAAYYSQRRNDTLCPVICTPKKHVRKPKGSVPGAVVVDKEEQVVMVEPGLPA